MLTTLQTLENRIQLFFEHALTRLDVVDRGLDVAGSVSDRVFDLFHGGIHVALGLEIHFPSLLSQLRFLVLKGYVRR